MILSARIIIVFFILNATAFAQQAPKIVLLQNPEPDRPSYPLLLSKGRGYLIKCPEPVDRENIIRGLGALIAPSEEVDLSDPRIAESKPESNPLLCPADNDYKIKLYAHASDGGMKYYLRFPDYTDQLYIPGCIGLLNGLGLVTSEAEHADPTSLSSGGIHKIECLSGEPITVLPETFAQWCTKTDRTDAETETVRAMLGATPFGSAGINNPPVCKQADTFLDSLTSLYLNDKGVQSTKPLAVLDKLTILSLRANAIKNISSLMNLRNLTYLDLSENEISNTEALAPLTALKTLNLSGNTIQQIDPLLSLTELEFLDLGWNRVNDLWPLIFLQKITRLSLAGNGLTGNMLEPLIELSTLTSLDLSKNMIETFEYIGEFSNSLEIDLSGNPIVESNALSFEEVCVLHRDAASTYGETIRKMMEVTQKTTCKEAAGVLASSVSLDLSGKGISDVAPIALLTQLTYLNLADNQIRDISPLANFSGPVNIDLTGNPILDTDKFSFEERCVLHREDVSPYGNTMRKLLEVTQKDSCKEASEVLLSSTSLDLSRTGISDVTPIALLPQLTHLKLADNQIEDIDSLASLTKLIELDLENNKIKDISVIAPLVQLKKFNAAGNPVNVDDYLPACLMRQYHNDSVINNFLSKDHVTEIDVLYEAGGRKNCLNSEKRLSELKRDDDDGMEFYDLFVEKGLRTVDYFKVLKNINYLDLWNNSLTDVTALQSLPKLSTLMLGSNPITSLNAVKSLTQLEYLTLRGTPLNSLEGIHLMTNLGTINIFSTKIYDLSPLLKVDFPINVEMYELDNNYKLEEGSVTLRLEYESFIEYCLVYAFDGTSLLPKSSALPAKFRAIMKHGLVPLMKEDHVDIYNPQAMDEWAKNQESLTLTGKNITSIEPLRFFKKLRKLDLSNNKIFDLSPLANLTSLEELDLGKNQIKDTLPLKRLTNLKKLILNENELSNTTGPGTCKLNKLEELNFAHNRLSGNHVWHGCYKNLKRLILNNNMLTSIPIGVPGAIPTNPRYGLNRLHFLDIRFNSLGVWDSKNANGVYSALRGKLFLRGNPMCKWERHPNMGDDKWEEVKEAKRRLQNTACINTP